MCIKNLGKTYFKIVFRDESKNNSLVMTRPLAWGSFELKVSKWTLQSGRDGNNDKSLI